MKKKIALALLILDASLTFTACTLNNNSENNSLGFRAADEQNTNITSDNSEITNNTSNIEMTGSNGGNPNIATYIEVTVSEDKYFYENHEILFDDLIKVFDELDENTAVKISDENATLKAYESLTKALEERGILFEAAN